MSYNLDTEFNYVQDKKYPCGSVKLNLEIDEVTFGQLARFINPASKKSKADKGMPPK